MAHPHLKAPLAEFSAVVHRTKNRLVAIPAEVQRQLKLERRQDNHIVLVSIRSHGPGRWNHHYFKLTFDNEFAIPSDVANLRGGAPVDVRIHRVIRDRAAVEAGEAPSPGGAGLLTRLSQRPRSGWREDGAERLDDYLNEPQ
jgi:hypothetical protein